jgi:GNAT superfamily N-acetyltransferase
MTDLRIRTAREEDIGDMVRLQRESLPDTYGPFLADESLGPWIEDDGVERYVGEILGFASIAGALIDLLWVRADVRSQGIGSRLMDHAEPRIASRHPAAELECFEPNTRALRFYEQRGYDVTRRYLDPSAGVAKVVMRKRVRPRIEPPDRRRGSASA